MKKEEFIGRYLQFINETGLKVGDCPVGSGGTMVLLGLREETSDIDLEIPREIFEEYKETGLYEKTYFGDVEVLKYDEYIDLHELKEVSGNILIDGVCSWSPEKVLLFKQSLNREKDQKDILKLRKYLGKD